MGIRLFALILITCVLNLGCQKLKEPSVLIVAIEDLSSTDIPCTSERFTESFESGFRTLCQESIRFTHAYTTSLMSTAGLASILTGQYPLHHGLRHNGQFLKPQIMTAPELAVEKNYRTAFFSGGAPILRKTGLSQGFEIFDDEIAPIPELIFRPLKATMARYISWLEQHLNRKSLSVIYVPDLIFTQVQTQTKTGEPRSFSFDSQLEEVDENLHQLFQKLKDTGRWAQTHIIVVGLTGHSQSERRGEIGPLNLQSENSQVAFFFKPAGPTRDSDRSWKIDDNVSLADIGATLIEIISGQTPISQNQPQAISLLPHLYDFKATIPTDRTIYIETAWPQWRYNLPVRFAFVKEKYIWINDNPAKVYNSLIDNFELNPIKPTPFFEDYFRTDLQNLAKLNIPPFPGLPEQEMRNRSIHPSIWLRKDRQEQLLSELAALAKQKPINSQILKLYYKALLEQGQLEDVARKITISNYSSEILQDLDFLPTTGRMNDFCWNLQTDPINLTVLKQCPDELWVDFILWIRARELDVSADFQRKRFEQKYWYFSVDNSIAKQAIASQHVWDVNPRINWTPKRIEMAFLMPQFIKEKINVQNSLRVIEKQHRQLIDF